MQLNRAEYSTQLISSWSLFLVESLIRTRWNRARARARARARENI